MAKSPSRVRRVLRLTTPAMSGPDVVALQRAGNGRAKPRGIEPTAVDGHYGPDTRRLLRQVIYARGGSAKRFDRVGATVTYQRIVRLKLKRPPTWLAAAKIRDRRKAGPERVLDFMRSHLGVHGRTTQPVLGWCRECGIGPAPWCGVAVVKALRTAGLTARSEWRYVPTLLADAQRGWGGYRIVRVPEPGDIVVFKWPGVSNATGDHTGFVETVVNSHMDDSLEGNTSGTAGGSQNNGDSLQRKQRNEFGVVAYIRPPYTG